MNLVLLVTVLPDVMLRADAWWRDFATGGAVKIVEFSIDGGRSFGKAEGVAKLKRRLSTGRLDPAVFRGLGNDFPALLDTLEMHESIAIDSAHVLHACGGNSRGARINLPSADHEPTAPATIDSTNTRAIQVGLQTKVIDCNAVVQSVTVSLR